MAFAMGTHPRGGRGRVKQRGQAAVAAGAGQGPGGRRGRQEMPVLYDAGGSGEAGGGGVQMEGGGEGVLQLMGGRRRRVGTREIPWRNCITSCTSPSPYFPVKRSAWRV